MTSRKFSAFRQEFENKHLLIKPNQSVMKLFQYHMGVPITELFYTLSNRLLFFQ